MTGITNFKEILVWRKAHELVKEIYKVTKIFPFEERHALSNQMRRAAYSIPCNVVEGFKRNGKTDSLRFYNIAAASLEELRYQTLLACELGYFDKNKYLAITNAEEEISKMLSAWIRTCKRK